MQRRPPNDSWILFYAGWQEMIFMNIESQWSLAAAGTGGTFFLNEVNPVLGFLCGVLTLTHVSIALYRQNKTKKEKEKEPPKRPFL